MVAAQPPPPCWLISSFTPSPLFFRSDHPQSIPDRSLISGIVSGYFDAYYNAKPNHAVSPDEAGSSSTAGGHKKSRSHVSADTSDDMIYDSE